MIAGDGIDCEDEEKENLDVYVELKQFIANCNGKESLHEVVKS